MNDRPIDTDIMTAEEAGKYLKVSKPFMVKLAKDGKVPATKIGRYWRFTRSSLESKSVPRVPCPIHRCGQFLCTMSNRDPS